jgi:phage terminase large subunit-like protein
LAASLGMPLDEWQEYALEAAMGERADGRWVSKFVGISAPRQNGKSQLIVARALAGVLIFGEKTIIISAHETDTAREVWKRLLDVIEANPTLEARVTGRMDAINREFLSFGTGMDKQTIKLKARRASGARGFSADCLLLDEAQILGKRSWGSIVPTMSARPNPQLWLFGTPPTPEDDPFAFARVRESATKKKPRHTWLEWAADPTDDYDAPETWAKANPAFGVRISYEACADDRAAMDDEQFAMERLGMWADTANAGPGLDFDRWQSLADPSAERGGEQVFALSTAPDRSWASLAVAWRRPDGDVQVMLADYRQTTAWVKSRAEELGARWGGRILTDLESRDLLEDAETVPLVRAEASLDDAITAGSVHHGNEPALNTAVKGAKWRKSQSGDGRVLDRKGSLEISPVVAAALAVHGVMTGADTPPNLW